MYSSRGMNCWYTKGSDGVGGVLAMATFELYTIIAGSPSGCSAVVCFSPVLLVPAFAFTEDATLIAAPSNAFFFSFLHSLLWTFQWAF